MAQKYETELVERPAKQRRLERIAGAAGIVLAIALGVSVLLQNDGDNGDLLAALIYPAGVALVGGILLWKSGRLTELAPTAAALEQKASADAAAAERSSKFWNRWYVRYVVAATCLAGAWYVLTASEWDRYPRWAVYCSALMLAVVGAWKAREVALPLLGLGGLWLLFRWVSNAQLSTPGAIIIGAIIIAVAILHQKRS